MSPVKKVIQPRQKGSQPAGCEPLPSAFLNSTIEILSSLLTGLNLQYILVPEMCSLGKDKYTNSRSVALYAVSEVLGLYNMVLLK